MIIYSHLLSVTSAQAVMMMIIIIMMYAYI